MMIFVDFINLFHVIKSTVEYLLQVFRLFKWFAKKSILAYDSKRPRRGSIAVRGIPFLFFVFTPRQPLVRSMRSMRYGILEIRVVETDLNH